MLPEFIAECPRLMKNGPVRKKDHHIENIALFAKMMPRNPFKMPLIDQQRLEPF